MAKEFRSPENLKDNANFYLSMYIGIVFTRIVLDYNNILNLMINGKLSDLPIETKLLVAIYFIGLILLISYKRRVNKILEEYDKTKISEEGEQIW